MLARQVASNFEMLAWTVVSGVEELVDDPATLCSEKSSLLGCASNPLTGGADGLHQAWKYLLHYD